MTDFKSYFHSKYQGGEDFIRNVILPIFGEDRYENAYQEDVLENNQALIRTAQNTGIAKILRLGTIEVPMNPTDVFDITVSDQVQMRRNRVAVQQLIRRVMSTYSSAFMIFHYSGDDKWDWRFTFCSKQGSNQDSTDSKRYTFLLGPNQSCRTAAENFKKLADKGGNIELNDIVTAFDVEALSKEFFTKYKVHYDKFCQFVYDNKDNREYFGQEFSRWEDKIIRDYVKKLLGRIVFLHFLQKKGWLGVPSNGQWGDGDTQFMKHLFEASSDEQKSDYLDTVLEPLFSKALNASRANDVYNLKVPGFTDTKIPYLNGGLFEKDELDNPKSTFPADYFADLFEFFYEYNFTIDENDPDDAEVGIDPEMLGRIFENLLEDNKDKGAYYTPKEIVQYMCRESLVAYLTTCVIKKHGDNHRPEDEIQASVRKLLKEPEAIVPKMSKEQLEDFGSYIRNVKICDPAIGSGAFPMGLLNELVRCRASINAWATDEKGTILSGDYAALKTEIINNNIYGVDIEKGAIDIARLRFWLSIVVDEQTPEVLPNLDYKFMQGNSLITTFNGEYINLDTNSQQHTNVVGMKKEKAKLYSLKQKYYSATGDAKYQLGIDIKDSILTLISYQLGYEIQSWYEKNSAKQLSLFPETEPRQLSFADIKEHLPAEKQKIMDVGIAIRKQLADTTRSLAERAQTDIRFFDWRIMFTEVFEGENPGFDIVIGNPPWGAKLSNVDKKILKEDYKNIDSSTPNSFAYFIGWAKRYCSATFSYVLPDSILIKDYAKTRKYIYNEVSEIIWYQNCGVPRDEKFFIDVEHDVCVIKCDRKCQKMVNLETNSYVDGRMFKERNVWEKSEVIRPEFEYAFNLKVSKKDVVILKKISKYKSIDIDLQCHEGIHTGNVRDKLFTTTYSNGLKPLFYGGRAGDIIKTYYSKRSGWYVDYRKEIIDIGMGEYASLRDEQIFIQPKIYITRTGNPFKAFYDEMSYASNNFFSLQYKDYNKNSEDNLLLILPFVNSVICQYFIRKFAAPRLGDTFVETKIFHLLKFPIPEIKDDERAVILNLVRKIIASRKINVETNTKEIEQRLETIIFKIYGFNDVEINLIKNS